MFVSVHNALSSMPKEPFELERLASELGVDRDDEQDVAFHALPTLEPLSHEHAQLKAPSFNAEDFLLSRAYTSLPDLGTELKEYLARLKEELVQLINDDYEAFISLSTDLRGEGARLERLHFPLPALRKEIEVCCTPDALAHELKAGLSQLSTAELKQVQDAVQEKLQERAAIREEKARLVTSFTRSLAEPAHTGSAASSAQNIRVGSTARGTAATSLAAGRVWSRRQRLLVSRRRLVGQTERVHCPRR